MPTEGFHEGELAVQSQAGVRADAARLTPMLATPNLNGGTARFLADRDFAVITARDAEHRLWTSPLFTATGFRDAHDTTMTVRMHRIAAALLVS